MILVDTSVWVLHLRESIGKLISLLNNGEVLCHPFIIGEIACGNLKNRTVIINLLKSLSSVDVVGNNEILQFIEHKGLMGKGLGYMISIFLLLLCFPMCNYRIREEHVCSIIQLHLTLYRPSYILVCINSK